MGLLSEEVFICIDCETTGLDSAQDRIIEVAAVLFTFSNIESTFETLINPGCLISPESIQIHNIYDEMVQGKPAIDKIIPQILTLIDKHVIIGHGIQFDIDFLAAEAKRHRIPNQLDTCRSIDTLRLARLYGQSSTNSLENLRKHFNIPEEGAHRAMNDVMVNIEVFKHLTKSFKTTEDIFNRLKKPILLRIMPLGKYKGRPFSEIPIEYLYWGLKKDFDLDLTFSLKHELKRRRQKGRFENSANPFSAL